MKRKQSKLSKSDRKAIKRTVCSAVISGFRGDPAGLAKDLAEAFAFTDRLAGRRTRLSTSPAG